MNQVPAQPAATAPARQGRQVLLVCVLLVLAVLAVFGQTTRFEFVDYDDDVLVYQNPMVANGFCASGVVWALMHSQASNWVPLTTVSHMLDCQFFGGNAGRHHMVNVLLHAANAVLLFLVLRHLTGNLWSSAMVAAVFAVHPLRAESVAWVSERKDVLSGLFFMLGLGAYARYARVSKVQSSKFAVFYGLSLLFLALGLMAKSMVATLPFVLLLLDYWPLGRMASVRDFWELVREKMALFIISAGACVGTALAPGLVITADRLPLAPRLGNAAVSCLVYLRQQVWPGCLACLYTYAPEGEPVWKVGLALTVVVGILVAAVWWRRSHPYLLVGWLWYLGMVAPVLGIVQISYSAAHSDRYTYLPGIGLAIAATWLVGDWTRRWKHRPLILGSVSCVVVGVLAFFGYEQTGHWRNSETLWRQAIQCDSENRFAHYNLGIILLSKGQTNEAIAQYRRAVEINPRYTEALNNLGMTLFDKGETNEGMAQYRRALEVDPKHERTRYNLASALALMGRLDEAADQYRQVLRSAPDLVMAHNALAVTLERLGQTDEAIGEYRQVLKLEPANIEALNHLGLELSQTGRLEEAIETYREAIRIDPRQLDAYGKLGTALSQKGEKREAIDCWQRCLAIQPNQPQVQEKLAWLLATAPDASLRDGAQAVVLAERADYLTSGRDPLILRTLAAAYEESKRWPEALAAARRARDLALAQTNAALAGALEKDLQRYEAMGK